MNTYHVMFDKADKKVVVIKADFYDVCEGFVNFYDGAPTLAIASFNCEEVIYVKKQE